MSIDALGLFLIGMFCFFMGRDYNPRAFEFTLKDTGVMMLAVWAIIGCMGFIFDWIHVGGVQP
ncbi:hypothetical protein Q8W40_13740 [Vibrio penaeicida]|uniref:hypothetical protein n=1 Tax=Vibrio penaeicida TaxID=104609 RepID=UPI002734CF20|nr:hypothetical protein [Vibrio penaeicida]MDP2573248.1 hypothetical protein [Vibrio penaeicida]